MSPLRNSAAITLAAALIAPAAASAGPPPLVATPHTKITSAWTYSDTSTPGDVDGDGREDLGFIPASCGSTATIVFGADAAATVDATAPGARGLTITGLPNNCDSRVMPIGDVNGDGRDDIAIGLTIVFGRGAGTVDLGSIGTAGLTIPSASTNGFRVDRLSRVGDVNGDGRDDIGAVGYYTAPPPAWRARSTVGVIFGRATGGTLPVGDPSLPGFLLAGDDATAPYALDAFGDVNHDGRDDVLVRTGTRPFVVYGRTTSGAIDLRSPGSAALALPASSSALTPVGDISGDGLTDQMVSEYSTSRRSVALTSTSAPLLDVDAANRRLEITASLGTLLDSRAIGDATADGRADLGESVLYPSRTSTEFIQAPSAASLAYVIPGTATPGKLDLRLNGTRVEGLPDESRVVGTLRFRTGSRRQVVATTPDGVIVADIAPRATPDTAPPVLSNVGFDRSVIIRSCPSPCGLLSQAKLRYAVDETAYLELQIRRGTTLVGTSGVTVTAQAPTAAVTANSFWFDANRIVGCLLCEQRPYIAERLPAGLYTATLRATDMAGNRSGAKTATIVVQ
ncbi:MAG: VCBS repeat-containing protein [Solirubrobacteraceae bacterium]|nr:VCBS repeat-containing protein [Solirubrobacteraceae bacterium]